jgi:hypothetical protein
MVCQSQGNLSRGNGDAKGQGKIEIETKETRKTNTKEQRLSDTIYPLVKDRDSRAGYEYARTNCEYCEGKRIPSTIGTGDTDSNYGK